MVSSNYKEAYMTTNGANTFPAGADDPSPEASNPSPEATTPEGVGLLSSDVSVDYILDDSGDGGGHDPDHHTNHPDYQDSFVG